MGFPFGSSSRFFLGVSVLTICTIAFVQSTTSPAAQPKAEAEWVRAVGPRSANLDQKRLPHSVDKRGHMTSQHAHLKVGASLSSFGADLFARLCKDDTSNVFISPLSIASALAMVASGATPGDSQQTFSSVLHLDMQDPADLSLWQNASATLSKPGSAELLQANSLWAHSTVLPTYKDKVQQAFGALVAALPTSAQPINAWTANATKGLIPEIVDDATVADPLTRAVLVNAVYFKGSWETAFNADRTRPGTFKAAGTDSPCMMMSHKKPIMLPFAEMPDGSTAVALPYKGSRFRQILVLPDEDGADTAHAGALAASLASGASLASLRERLALSSERVRLQLPRFKMEYGVKDLKGELQAAGLGAAFDSDGGFLGISTDPLLRLSKVLHKAVIEVNEEGTVAAAATAAVMMTRSAMIEPPVRDFIVDRPFVLIIEDIESGSPLFMGRVVAPTFTGLTGGASSSSKAALKGAAAPSPTSAAAV